VALLQGKKMWEDKELELVGVKTAAMKGDPRVEVGCGMVERLVFGGREEEGGYYLF